MASENGGDGALVMPPTIQALLQARLDRLSAGEREVVGCGAVEGQVFHGTAVEMLADDPMRAGNPGHLLSLVRKELIRPERSTRPQDEAFRFRHLLIRDAAYDALPKETRAELHERFASWLEGHGELVELDEIVGYHLEQAHRNRTELDATDPHRDELAHRAAAHLHRAARKATARGDVPAARGLLERSVGLLPEGDPQRLVGLIDVVDPLCQIGRIEDARAAAAELDASVDRRYRAYGALLGCTIDLYAGTHDRQATQARIDAARSAFLELGEELGLAYCELLQAGISWTALRAEETRAAAHRGLAHAAAAGADHLLHELDGWEFPPLVFGPLHVEEGLRLTEDALERAKGKLLFEARLWSTHGRLLAMCGEADRGRELVRAGLDRAREAGLLVDAAAGSMAAAFVELHAGDLEAAERLAREGLPELERLGDRAHHPTLALMLAERARSSGAPRRGGTLVPDRTRDVGARRSRQLRGPRPDRRFPARPARRARRRRGSGSPRRRTRRDDGLRRRARAWP